MPSTPLFEFADVTLRLGDSLFFQNSRWTFSRNENWILVGGNGSGKTVLARALAGEIPVINGDIHYNIVPPEDRVPEDCIRLVSFEQQKAAAGDAPDSIRWFSMEQEMAVSVGKYLSQEMVEEINPFEVRARREQAPAAFRKYRLEILDIMQIRPLLRRKIPSLSNGEMRKVLIARALLRKPKLLILDDAFAGLDAKYRIHLKRVLENLMKRHSVRILLIASLLHEIPRGITHMLVVDSCRIVAQGRIQEIIRRASVQRLFKPDALHSRFALWPDSKRRSNMLKAELVRLEHVSVSYDGHPILADISWAIHKGESWALVGPNGSGKSTLLSLINGDNPQAYANRVYLFGRRRGSGESIWEIKRRIGFISAEMHLHFPGEQTCLETILSGYGSAAHKFSKASVKQHAEASNLLKLFGLDSLSDAPLHSLSMGHQRAVLLARAVVKRPDLLLLDEPCQGLDLKHRTIFLRFLESLIRQSQATIVFVTHRRDEIPKGIGRILRLEGGRIRTCT